jgi:pyruvate/2-oxoglutarate/acetoin dehydrogenase E1 component
VTTTVPKVFFREAICRALAEEMVRDPHLTLFGQDIGQFGGPYQQTRGLYGRFGPQRVRDMPVAEAVTVGIALGAAAAGVRSVGFITYMDFLTLGLDALVNYGAKLRYKTGGQLSAPAVIVVTAGAKGQGVAHSQALHSWLLGVPGLKVVAPFTAADAYGLLKTALRDSGPVVFIDHKRLFPRTGWLPDDEAIVPFGVASVVRAGDHVTVVAHSFMTAVALDAAEALGREGLSCEVLDLRSLWPLDVEAIVRSVRRTGALLIVEEGQSVCGVAAEIAFRVSERLPGTRVGRLGAARAPISSNPIFESFCMPSAEGICHEARHLAAVGPRSQARARPGQ